MSGNGMGGDVYDAILEAYVSPNVADNIGGPTQASVLVCSYEHAKTLCEQFSTNHPPNRSGYVGLIFNIPIWIDNRFDQPVFLSSM